MSAAHLSKYSSCFRKRPNSLGKRIPCVSPMRTSCSSSRLTCVWSTSREADMLDGPSVLQGHTQQTCQALQRRSRTFAGYTVPHQKHRDAKNSICFSGKTYLQEGKCSHNVAAAELVGRLSASVPRKEPAGRCNLLCTGARRCPSTNPATHNTYGNTYVRYKPPPTCLLSTTLVLTCSSSVKKLSRSRAKALKSTSLSQAPMVASARAIVS